MTTKYPNSACELHKDVSTSEPVCIVCLKNEIERLKSLVNLCIDDPQNWAQRGIELELTAGQDAEWYNQSVLAENKKLKITLQDMLMLIEEHGSKIMLAHATRIAKAHRILDGDI